MDYDVFFHELVKKPLNELLIELSHNNIDLLALRSQENTTRIVEKIHKSFYFLPSVFQRNESYDCHARCEAIIDKKAMKIWSSHPFCLAPIPNKNFFYCRGNLSEATKSKYDEIIPSRDYSSHSYKWNHLYCVKHVDEALGIVLNKLCEKSLGHKKHRIHLFGFMEDQQRSYTQTLSSKALVKLCCETTNLRKMCEREGFEFFAISLDHISHASKSTLKETGQFESRTINRSFQPVQKKQEQSTQNLRYIRRQS